MAKKKKKKKKQKKQKQREAQLREERLRAGEEDLFEEAPPPEVKAEAEPTVEKEPKKKWSLWVWWRERRRKKAERKKALYVERRAFIFFGKKKMRKKKGVLQEYGEAFLVALLLALIIRTFIFQAFMIPSGSMEDTLLVGDYVLVNKFVYRFWEPERGDIIVFKYPLQDNTINPLIWLKELFMKIGGAPTPPRMDYIKRIVGLPGETMEVIDGVVYIDGQALGEPYMKEPPNLGIFFNEQFGPITIPEDSYFMMGDNRNESKDSRFWGVLQEDLIKGKAVVIYWSWAHSDCPIFFPAPGGGMVKCGGKLEPYSREEAAIYLSEEAMEKADEFYLCQNPKCHSVHRYWWDIIPEPFYKFWKRVRFSRIGDIVR